MTPLTVRGEPAKEPDAGVLGIIVERLLHAFVKAVDQLPDDEVAIEVSRSAFVGESAIVRVAQLGTEIPTDELRDFLQLIGDVPVTMQIRKRAEPTMLIRDDL